MCRLDSQKRRFRVETTVKLELKIGTGSRKIQVLKQKHFTLKILVSVSLKYSKMLNWWLPNIGDTFKLFIGLL